MLGSALPPAVPAAPVSSLSMWPPSASFPASLFSPARWSSPAWELVPRLPSPPPAPPISRQASLERLPPPPPPRPLPHPHPPPTPSPYTPAPPPSPWCGDYGWAPSNRHAISSCLAATLVLPLPSAAMLVLALLASSLALGRPEAAPPREPVHGGLWSLALCSALLLAVSCAAWLATGVLLSPRAPHAWLLAPAVDACAAAACAGAIYQMRHSARGALLQRPIGAYAAAQAAAEVAVLCLASPPPHPTPSRVLAVARAALSVTLALAACCLFSRRGKRGGEAAAVEDTLLHHQRSAPLGTWEAFFLSGRPQHAPANNTASLDGSVAGGDTASQSTITFDERGFRQSENSRTTDGGVPYSLGASQAPRPSQQSSFAPSARMGGASSTSPHSSSDSSTVSHLVGANALLLTSSPPLQPLPSLRTPRPLSLRFTADSAPSIAVEILGHEEKLDNPARPDISKTYTEYVIRTTLTPTCFERGEEVFYQMPEDESWHPAVILEVGTEDGERSYILMLPHLGGAASATRAATIASLKPRSPPQALISRHRFTDFERLLAQLARRTQQREAASAAPFSPAKLLRGASSHGASVRLPSLPSKNSKRSALGLEAWLESIVAEPAFWSPELCAFLGINAAGVPSPTSRDGWLTQDILWIFERMQRKDSGLRIDPSSGTFRGSQLVDWLLAQALATSRQEAATMAEDMRVRGLLESAQGPAAFVDGKLKYRFVDSSRLSALDRTPSNPF